MARYTFVPEAESAKNAGISQLSINPDVFEIYARINGAPDRKIAGYRHKENPKTKIIVRSRNDWISEIEIRSESQEHFARMEKELQAAGFALRKK